MRGGHTMRKSCRASSAILQPHLSMDHTMGKPAETQCPRPHASSLLGWTGTVNSPLYANRGVVTDTRRADLIRPIREYAVGVPHCHGVTTIVEDTVLAVCPSNWSYHVGGTSHLNTTAMDVGLHFVCGTGSPLTHLMVTALLGWGRRRIWGPLGATHATWPTRKVLDAILAPGANYSGSMHLCRQNVGGGTKCGHV